WGCGPVHSAPLRSSHQHRVWQSVSSQGAGRLGILRQKHRPPNKPDRFIPMVPYLGHANALQDYTACLTIVDLAAVTEGQLCEQCQIAVLAPIRLVPSGLIAVAIVGFVSLLET